LRFALWGGSRSLAQAIAEVVLFTAVVAATTWALERSLLGELRTYLGDVGGEAPTGGLAEPLAPAQS